MKTISVAKSLSFAAALISAFSLLGSPISAHENHSEKSAASANGIPKDYPLKKCVVSDDPLGEHGKAIKVTAPDGTDVYLCCKDCIKDFKKNPAKYAKMVNDAAVKK